MVGLIFIEENNQSLKGRAIRRQFYNILHLLLQFFFLLAVFDVCDNLPEILRPDSRTAKNIQRKTYRSLIAIAFFQIADIIYQFRRLINIKILQREPVITGINLEQLYCFIKISN